MRDLELEQRVQSFLTEDISVILSETKPICIWRSWSRNVTISDVRWDVYMMLFIVVRRGNP